jgi:hypothetical protein
MKISPMVAKNILIKTRIKTIAIIYKVTEMKTCLRAMGCARKVNMATSDKESIRKEVMEHKGHGQKVLSMAEFNM